MQENEQTSWFLYVVKCSDDSLYTGVTSDIKRRISEHNKGSKGAKYTRSRRPVELVFWLDFSNRSTAMEAENRFKKLTRKEKEQTMKLLIETQPSTSGGQVR